MSRVLGWLVLVFGLNGCATPSERWGDLPQARLAMESPNPYCLFRCHVTVEQTTVWSPDAAAPVSVTGGAITQTQSTTRGTPPAP